MSASLGTTTSVCPECFERLPATYEERDGRVHLVRTCPSHGEHAPAVWASATHYRWAADFAPAGPATDGLSVDNAHACLAVVEVTTRCNLKCSYCFASSGPVGDDLSRHEFHELLDVVRADGTPRPVQFSGGEPTVRDDLVQLVRDARERGFDHVEINTNGIRLADEPGYAAALKRAGVTAIYLQFDGIASATHKAIRGPDLSATKAAAIEACREAGLPVILVCTVVKGLNDHELGDIVRLALENHDVVRAVNFQPAAHFGRYAEDTGLLSLDAVARLLSDQTDFLEQHDLLPVPCCSAYCQAATALLPTPDGGAVPLTRFIDEALWAKLAAAVQESDWMELLAGTADAEARSEYVAACCGIELDGGIASLVRDVLPIGITGFMDADAADLERVANCCVAVPTRSGGLVPFCAYNMTTRDGRYHFRETFGWEGRTRVS